MNLPFSMASIDAVSRLISSLKASIAFEVVIRGLLVGPELGKCVGHGEHGFLHRRIQQAAAAQLEPRRERALKVLALGVGPAETEQRLVRERPVETHALQRRLGLSGRDACSHA